MIPAPCFLPRPSSGPANAATPRRRTSHASSDRATRGSLPTAGAAALALCVLIALAGVSRPTTLAADDQPPNVIVILTDDLGYGDVGVFGGPFPTPRLDRMAAEGAILTSFYSPTPYCSPARAAVLTGRHPLRCGMTRVPFPPLDAQFKDADHIGLPVEENTLGDLLGAAGHRTALVGKWHLGQQPPFLPSRRGFEEFFGILYSNDMHPVELYEGEAMIEYPFDQGPLTLRLTERSVDFIRANRDRPFFLYLAHVMPHKPLAVMKDEADIADGELYAETITELDQSTGEILDTLVELGIDRRTLVVFTSDNGPWYGGSTAGMRGMKLQRWEGGVRVPFIAWMPGVIPAGHVSDEPATLEDIFTTAMTVAGVDMPDDRSYDGRDLMPLLTSDAPGGHEALFFLANDRVASLRAGEWKLHIHPPSPPNQRVWQPGDDYRDPREPDGLRIIAPFNQPHASEFPGVRPGEPYELPALFNVATDRAEEHNVADQHPDLVVELMALADEFAQQALAEAAALHTDPANAGVRRGEGPPFVFADVTDASGLAEPLAGMLGHGAAWGDFDGDGRLDLFVGGFADRPDAEYAPADGPVPNRLFRNRGDGTFEVVDSSAMPAGPGGDFARTSGALFADLDNSGLPELYVANNARPQARTDRGPAQAAATVRRSVLYQNDNGVLRELPAAAGAAPDSLLSARNIGVLDIDGNGLLDLLVVEDRFTREPRTVLLRNLGDLRFEDATAGAGLPDDVFGLGLAVADITGNGFADFFVPHSNRLFLSRGDGRFREAVELAGVFAHEPFDNEDWPCGAVFTDLTRNGLLDLVVTTHSERGRIYLYLHEGVDGQGLPRYRDVTAEAGLDVVVPTKLPHVEAQDFDNDGWPDLYVSAGWLEDDRFTPLIFRHTGVVDGIPRFEPNRPITGPMDYYPAGPTADFDGDGRIDIFLCNWFDNNRSRLLRNESFRRHWIQVRVVGTRMNRDGIGAEVFVRPAGRPDELIGYQQISTGYGYASGQPAMAHFGLGDVDRVDVEVRFPGGGTVTKEDVPGEIRLVVEEPEE